MDPIHALGSIMSTKFHDILGKNDLTLRMDHYLAKEHARSSHGTPTATVRNS